MRERKPYNYTSMNTLALSKFATALAALPLLMVVSACGLRGQGVEPESVPTQHVASPLYQNLPLDSEARKTVEDAVKSRDYARAEESLAREIAEQPKSYALLASLGRVFFLDGKYLNCAVALKKAERNAPLEDSDRYTLALAYIVLKKPDWARPELERLAKSNPANPLYVYWGGRIDYDEQRFKAAALEFEKAAALDPGFMKAYDNLGLTYEALGDFDRAIRNYRQATDFNRRQASPSPWPLLNLGALLIRTGEYQRAEDALRESLRCDSRFPMAHYQLGRVLEKRGKDADALDELRQAVLYGPDYPDPHYVMGRIYERAGEKQKAELEWKTFQLLKQKHPHTRVH